MSGDVYLALVSWAAGELAPAPPEEEQAEADFRWIEAVAAVDPAVGRMLPKVRTELARHDCDDPDLTPWQQAERIVAAIANHPDSDRIARDFVDALEAYSERTGDTGPSPTGQVVS